MNENEALKALSEIKEALGMEFIEKFVKDEKKRAKPRRTKMRVRELRGAEAYFELFGLDFDNEESYKNFTNADLTLSTMDEAKRNVAEKYDVQPDTIEGHITAFNKEAEKLDYIQFSDMLEKYLDRYAYYGKSNLEMLKDAIFTIDEFNKYKKLDIRILIAFYIRYEWMNKKDPNFFYRASRTLNKKYTFEQSDDEIIF